MSLSTKFPVQGRELLFGKLRVFGAAFSIPYRKHPENIFFFPTTHSGLWIDSGLVRLKLNRE